MLHLPALVFTGQIAKILQAIAKLGMNVRGLYGEGTEAMGKRIPGIEPDIDGNIRGRYRR